MFSDMHMHCNFSADSEADPEDMINAGIKADLKYICFTDHQDFDFPPNELVFEFNTDSYFKTLIALKEKYQKEIKVLIGVELGLQPHLAERLKTYLNQYPFDFCIGSSHLVNGRDPYYPEYFENRPEIEAYKEYFESVIDNLNAFTFFDVYGHIDYIFRYGPTRNSILEYNDLSELIDEILKKIIMCGHGIEINTAGFRYGLKHPNPDESILKRYTELGGEIITIGSDAHKPVDMAYNFKLVPDILKSCGFKYYTVFEHRNPTFYKL